MYGMGQGQSETDLTALTNQQILDSPASETAWQEIVRRTGVNTRWDEVFHWAWALIAYPGTNVPGWNEVTQAQMAERAGQAVVPGRIDRPVIGMLYDGSGAPSMRKVLAKAQAGIGPYPIPGFTGPPYEKPAPPSGTVTEAELEADWARQQAAIAAAIAAEKAKVKIPAEAPPVPIFIIPSDEEITPAPRYPEVTAPAAGITAGTVLLIGAGLLVLRGLFK